MTKIIFLPARMLDENMYEAQINYFKDKFEIKIADFTKDNSIQEMSDRVIADLLKEEEKAIFVSVSMGGYVALDIVKRYQNKVQGLVLIATNARNDNMEQKLLRLKEIKYSLTDFDNIVKNMIKSLLSPENAKDISFLNKLRDISMSLGKKVYRSQQYAIMKRDNMLSSLMGITCPTLIIGGEFDQITRYDFLDEMHKRISDSEFEIIKDGGHLVVMEKAYEFNILLESFIARRIKN